MVIFALFADLWAPDEPRYGEVAREVYERGSFLVMHLCGAVYPDKPPLLFWLSGLGGWLTGWSEWALRAPSLMATALTAWLVAVLAKRWWGREEARWAPVMFLTFFLVVKIGGRLQIDPLLTVLCVGALVVGTVPATDSRTRTRGLLAAGLLVGFAALAKGPVAFINVGSVAVAWRFLAADREERMPVPRWVWPAVAVLAAAPALVWALTASMTEPKLFEALFFDQHLGRVTKADRHPGPVWKYVTRLPVLLLPWTLVVWAGLTASWRQWRERGRGDADKGLVRAALWLGVLVLVYSLLPPKRDLYLLSAYPAAALLAARALGNRTRQGLLEGWLGWGTSAALCGIGTVLSGAVFFSDHLDGLWWRGPAIGVPLVASGCCAGWAAAHVKPGIWARSIVTGWLLFLVGVGLFILP
ncbi:MAG: glycosyltransferase family 39 protein, partial [Acidobacteriota bacterium]